MVSFFMDCPQCGVMIPKGSPCGDCHWSENAEANPALSQDLVLAYDARRKSSSFNFSLFMILAFATAMISMLTAAMWFRFMYFGSIGAFLMIGVLTVFAGVLSVITAFSKKLFPTALNCPACEFRVDELGLDGGHCPNCSTRLK